MVIRKSAPIVGQKAPDVRTAERGKNRSVPLNTDQSHMRLTIL